MLDITRMASYRVLYDIYFEGAYSNIRIQEEVKENREINGNLLRELVYGVLENTYYLDYIIRKYSTTRIKKIKKEALICLRLGVYQIVFIDSVPNHSAVDESVKIIKELDLVKLSGFVNGILRNVVRNLDEAVKIEGTTDVEYLSIRYSYPTWLVERWIDLFGYKFTKELCISGNKKPDLNIRVNNTKTDVKTLMEALLDKDFKVKRGNLSKDILIVENPKEILQLSEYRDGHFTIQDESSSLVGLVVNPEKGSTVLDLCSAPGGKTTHMAELMENTGIIYGYDIHDHKLGLIKSNADRLGLTNIELKVQDATKRNEDFVDLADYVLLDVPCSGLGIIRRKPEIKLTKDEKDIDELVKIQKDILNNCKDYVKAGGHLIYSTCTLEPRENIEMIEEFLRENDNFKMEKLDDYLGDGKKDIESLKDNYIQLYPNINDTDGFFIVKLVKDR